MNNFERERRKWTEKEINYLLEKWGSSGVEKIAKYLKRKETAVIAKARKLGLKTLYKGEYLTTPDIAAILGITQQTVWKWIKTNKFKISKKNILNRKMYLITLENLVKWLKDNQDSWDASKVELYALGIEPKWLIEKRKIDAKKYKKRYKSWSKNEDFQLINMYKLGYRAKDIAKEINRSVPAVNHRIRRLDIWGNGMYLSC
ncbi:helix-turn-helix domain-containing protein [Eubacterium multiforme]|uniref:Biotin operon repressor n=1 Tax=Eubacterium multiforme TaxID=83339 RepID=A0ABT9US53_9FIRM|nr:helix-turn-helix domain-containing protein [Eubacterium multiforme]MDQ0149147.1 biotin operon repressor [Eubacterium multiforme]